MWISSNVPFKEPRKDFFTIVIQEEKEEEVTIPLPTDSHFYNGIKATVPNPL